MVKKIIVKDLDQVRNIVNIARTSIDDIDVKDQAGAIANAKSILGLLSLDFSKPVTIEGNSAEHISKIYTHLN